MVRPRVKVALVIDDLGHGGAQRQLSMLAPALAARAPEVGVVVVSMSSIDAPYAALLGERGVPVRFVPRRASLDFSRPAALCRLLRREGADVVHPFLEASDVHSFVAARWARLPVVLSIRSDRLSFTGARAVVLRAMLRRADRVVVNSEVGRRMVVSDVGVDEDRAVLVRNCVEERTGGGDVAPLSDTPVVGFVGRLVALKRVDRLIEAFAAISEEYPRARLTIVGDGPERGPLGGVVRRFALDARVTFAGAVADARALVGGFSCLALPSTQEGLPNSALEALAEGVPVVAHPVGDLPAIVLEGRTGLLVPDDSVGALAAALSRVLADPELRSRCREEGPRLIREHFSTDRAVDALVSVYRRLVAGR